MSIPQSFKERMKQILKDEYEDFLNSYNNGKNQGLRINTIKISKDEFLNSLPFEIIDDIPWENRGIYINEEKPGKHPYHAAGLYYIQEPSAMSVVPNLDIKEGERVLDLCAAPGGKSTQAAAYLNGKGILVSNEIDSKRAKILSENIERLGVGNALVTNNSPKELQKFFLEFFDKIIVDAPCSGEGMFRKEEDALRDWSVENVKGCAIRQLEILSSAAKMLKSGGYIVYSTCTFSLEENEFVINKFLEENKDFNIIDIPKRNGFSSGLHEFVDNLELEKAARLFPHKLRGEGHFAALLKKNDGDYESIKELKSNIKLSDVKDYIQFQNENLNIKLEDNLYLFGDNLYRFPKGIPDIKGIKVLRMGLHLGTLKKNRFEPNHAFALWLKTDMIKRHINLSSKGKEILDYLKGNTILVDIPNGWCLVTVDGYSIGWGKVSNGILKNHYPKGLRW